MDWFGTSFMFDSVPCEMYDLMLYDIEQQDADIMIAGTGEIIDESVGDHWRPYYYGMRLSKRLEFDITFGVNTRRIDEGKFLDDFELAEVTAWLTGHPEYKWLSIDRPGARQYGYKCMITEMTAVRYGDVPWALRAHVTCDSPYAYLAPQETLCTVNGSATLTIFNESSLNLWYQPVIVFSRTGGTTFSLTNAQDGGRGPTFTSLPGAVSTFRIDNERGLITNNQNLNLYDAGFNFQFLRLRRGANTLSATGYGNLRVLCEYPVNVGG